MLVVQYLEDRPEVARIDAADARARLRAAFERLPITCVVLGWNVPDEVREACAQETARTGAQLYRWHPLLTGEATFVPRPEWQTIDPTGQRISGFRGLPEFTFICPNRPAASDAALEHLRQAIRNGPYQGVFLDRIRYPSPAADPERLLACFCDDCCRAGAIEGFDLADARRGIQTLLTKPERLRLFARHLLDPSTETESDTDLAMLRSFLDFRAVSVARFVRVAAEVARQQGLAVGLDCFSPALTSMVGQDLAALDPHCDWIKIMTYGHTLGPAGLPFELLGLANWLVGHGGMDEREAMECLALSTRLPLPRRLAALREKGLSSEALAAEVRQGRSAGVRTLLAGIELADLEGVTRLNPAQIAADLRAVCEAQPDGLVLSWDLWRIPLDWLDVVRGAWVDPKQNDSRARA